MSRFYFLILILCSLNATVNSDSSSCALYMAPSKVPGAGRGIFAGKSFSVDEFIEQDPSITMLYHHSSLTSLAHYVYSYNDDDYSMVNFGVGCLFNFIPSRVSVDHFWAEDDVSSGALGHTLPFTNSTHVYFQTTRTCSIGEELYVSYGDSWFEEREMFDHVDVDPSLPEDAFAYSPKELHDQGICLTDVMIATSSIPVANLGLHAFRSFQKGELITVSPVLVLPMSVVEDTVNSSVMMNYVWTEPGAKLGLFPLSHVAMINHASATATSEEASVIATANVEVTWFDWFQFSEQGGQKNNYINSTFRPNNLEMSYETIVNTPFAPLDIAIYASRDIALGEELFLNYGAEWENAWQTWLFDEKHSISQFRHPIHLPQGMLPRHWFEEETSFSTSSVNSSDGEHVSDHSVSSAVAATIILHSDL